MSLAQASMMTGILLTYGLIILLVVLILVAILRWALRINDLVKNQEEMDKSKYIRILLTKYDSRKSVSNEWVERQLEPYKEMLFETRIRQNEALNQAHMAQEAIFSFKPASPGAEDYNLLTKEFLNLCHLLETN